MHFTRLGVGLLIADNADVAESELWDRYKACCACVIKDASVLEVGCGAGEHSQEIIKLWQPNSYLGVDISPGIVRDAKVRYRELNFIAADACYLPLADASFDVVTSSYMFHHIPVELRVKALREQIRVGRTALLRDLFGMEPGLTGLLYKLYYKLFDGSEYRYTIPEWHQFIKSAGGHIIAESRAPDNIIRNRVCYFLITAGISD